jgi:polyhydroxybutyrate depolymerase
VVAARVGALHYRGRTNNADVLFNAVAGGGHSWPGGKKIPTFLVGKTIPDVDATRLMWDFFKEHPMTSFEVR